MATLPGLLKGVFQDPSPPLVDSLLSPQTIPNGTTLVTTKPYNETVTNVDELIDYVSGDNGPNFIPQLAIDSLVSDLALKEDTANKGAVSGYAGLDASQELLLANFPSGIALQVFRRNAGNTALEFVTLTASEITDFDTAVSANSDVTANTAKITNATHTGEVTGATVLTITNDAVTYAKIQNVVADDVLLGNVAGPGGIVTELTGAQVNLILPVFTDILNGLVPLSGGGTTNFLRADGTWAVPAGGGGGQVDSVVGTTNRISVNSGDPVNPIVDIDAAYVGQASITTLGTITTGVWNGTAITGSNINAALADLSDVTAKTGSGTIVVMDTSPTIVTPTIASFLNANHDHETGAGGGQLTATDALDATGTTDTTTFLRGDNTWAVPPGGGSQTPILQDVQYAGFDIKDISNIEFRETTGAPPTATNAIWADAAGVKIDSAVNDTVTIRAEGFDRLRINVIGIDILGADILMNGNDLMNFATIESNAANAATAGQIRLGNTETHEWRNAANTANLGYQFDVNDNYVFNSSAEVFGPNIVTNHATTTPINGDFLLISDTSDSGNIKKVDVAAFLGGGGEANTISSLGGGTVLTAAVPKSGVNLQTVSIATTGPISHNVAADLMTFSLDALVNADISATADIQVSKLLSGTAGQFLRTDSGGGDTEWTDDIFTINYIIDGGGSTITTGIKGTITVDFNCEVLEWAVTADQSGDIVVDVNRATFAGYPTTASIAGTELPTIVASTKGEDRTITTWSTIATGDVLEFEVDSITTLQRVTVSLVCRKTG